MESTDLKLTEQYSQSGQLVAGTDLADLYFSEEYAPAIQEMEESQAKEGMPDSEKEAMADNHEPFTILEAYTVETEYKNPHTNPDGDRWRIQIRNQAGQERLMLFSSHPQRDGILVVINHRLEVTKQPVMNCCLYKLFKSQGNWFYVIRPWT